MVREVLGKVGAGGVGAGAVGVVGVGAVGAGEVGEVGVGAGAGLGAGSHLGRQESECCKAASDARNSSETEQVFYLGARGSGWDCTGNSRRFSRNRSVCMIREVGSVIQRPFLGSSHRTKLNRAIGLDAIMPYSGFNINPNGCFN